MYVTEFDRVTTDRYPNRTASAKPNFEILEGIIENDIIPTLGATHARGSLRSILENYHASNDLSAITARILSAGEPVSVLIDELTHHACVAGILWDDDELDFCDVTARVARLQTIARQLSQKLDRSWRRTGYSILLMPSPRETHVFGLQLLEMAFRGAGWAVTRSGSEGEWPGERLVQTHYDVVGLSLSSASLLPHLRHEISRLRRVSRNQSLRVLVGGPCFDRGDADIKSVGADAYAPDACRAPTIAEEIVNEQKLICAGSSIS